MNSEFIIPLNGLAPGGSEFHWRVGSEFFEAFENTEILGADLQVAASARKAGHGVWVDCSMEGKVTVACDRCLEDLDLPVSVNVMLDVKYGEQKDGDEDSENGREMVFVPTDDTEFDLSQIVYDYACLSLPMQRHHEDGACNPDAIKHLGGSQEENDDKDESPFAALKGLFGE